MSALGLDRITVLLTLKLVFKATLDAIYGVEVDDSNIDTSDNNNNEAEQPATIEDTSSPRSLSDVNMSTNSSNNNEQYDDGDYSTDDDQKPNRDAEIGDDNDDNRSSNHILPSTSNLNDFTGLADRTANDDLSSIAYYAGAFDHSTSTIQTAQSISIQQQSQLYLDSIEDD